MAVRYAFFVMVPVRYVGTLFELIIPDFSHVAPDFVCRGKRQLKLTLMCELRSLIYRLQRLVILKSVKVASS